MQCAKCNDNPKETIKHVLVVCRATHAVRERLLPALLNIMAMVQAVCGILNNQTTPHILIQLVK